MQMEFTTAVSAHQCGCNSSHRVEKGMPRLTIRRHDRLCHYCLSCARSLLEQGTRHLHLLLSGCTQLEGR